MRLLKPWVALVLLGLLSIIPFVQANDMHTADPVDPAVQERALIFLSDVVGLDLSRYNITLRINQSWHFVPDLPSKQMLTYNLSCGQNVLDASFEATNNAGIALTMLDSLSGMPFLVNPAGNVLGEAKALLERYLDYSEAGYIQDMQCMLNAVSELKPMRVIMGNLTLQITQSDYITNFQWTHTIDNITNTHSRFGFQFQNGLVHTLFDEWTAYDIPEPQVNISREEAISRTKESTTQYAADKGYFENKLLYNGAYAMLSLQPREGKLYPLWEVVLPIEKTPPAPIAVSPSDPNYEWYKFYHDAAVSFYNSNRSNAIHVTIWADTGEVYRIYTDVALETQPNEDIQTIILQYADDKPEPSEIPNPATTQEPTASPSPTALITSQQSSSESTAASTLALPADVACLISVTSSIGIIALAFFIWKRQTEA